MNYPFKYTVQNTTELKEEEKSCLWKKIKCLSVGCNQTRSADSLYCDLSFRCHAMSIKQHVFIFSAMQYFTKSKKLFLFSWAEHVKTMLVKCNYCSKLFRHHFGKLYLIETNSENWRCWNKLHVQGTLNDTLCGINLPSCVQKGSSIQPSLFASVNRSRPTSYIES